MMNNNKYGRIQFFLLSCLVFLQHSPSLAADGVACNIIKIDKEGVEHNICSGTFISPTHFITAHHCTEIFSQKEFLHKIRCQGYEQRISIVSYISHPDYMPDNLTPYNDMAILNTEINPFTTSFPKIPDEGATINYYIPNSCYFRGFSEKVCSFGSGDDCLRADISVSTPKSSFILLETSTSCNIKTGKNCITSEMNINPSELSPLMLSITDKIESSWGDSGAGLICKDRENNDFLVGILALGIHDYMFVSTANKSFFIRSTLESSTILVPQAIQ